MNKKFLMGQFSGMRAVSLRSDFVLCCGGNNHLGIREPQICHYRDDEQVLLVMEDKNKREASGSLYVHFAEVNNPEGIVTLSAINRLGQCASWRINRDPELDMYLAPDSTMWVSTKYDISFYLKESEKGFVGLNIPQYAERIQKAAKNLLQKVELEKN